MNDGLAEALMRALERTAVDEEPAVYRCRYCCDTGVRMMTEGQFDVGGSRNGGKQRTLIVNASAVRPIGVRCACNPIKPAVSE